MDEESTETEEMSGNKDTQDNKTSKKTKNKKASNKKHPFTRLVLSSKITDADDWLVVNKFSFYVR